VSACKEEMSATSNINNLGNKLLWRFERTKRIEDSRPKKWDAKDEGRILRYLRQNPKRIWQDLKQDLDLELSKSTFQRILEKHHMKKWVAKKRPS
jgi:hypothetical protein